MKKLSRLVLLLGVVTAVVVLGFALLAPADAVAGKGGGGGKPPKTSCCNPALEPGVGGNPLCFENTCSSDGKWPCNNPDASPSCTPGQVCQ
jgi:hypothetical protein